jgi:hypothetical protein
MTFENALQLAETLAASFGVQLGECLFSDPFGDECWAFSFDIVSGPSDWSWTIIVAPDASKSMMFASHLRPALMLRPRIKRRWWLFGERLEQLPIFRQIIRQDSQNWTLSQT